MSAGGLARLVGLLVLLDELRQLREQVGDLLDREPGYAGMDEVANLDERLARVEQRLAEAE